MGAYLCGARSGDQLAVASGTTSERKKQEGTVNGTSPNALLKKLAIVFALMAIMTVSPPASDLPVVVTPVQCHCVAALASSRAAREITLHEQVPLPD